MHLTVTFACWFFLPATAKFSLLANNEEGKPSSRCFPEDYETILPDVKLLPVFLEENNWASHYIVTAVAGIIISEHIGHPLTFNVAGTLSRVFRRAALPASRLEKWKDVVSLDPDDGSQLTKVMGDDIHFAYANLEVWTATKQADLKEFVERLSAVKNIGSIGYPGREGWFVPRWIVTRCGALAYPSWLPGHDADVSTAFSNAGETISVAATKDKLDTCYETVPTSDCKLWIKDSEATEPQITVHVVKGYGGTFQEAFIKNNKMNAALKYHGYSEQVQYARDGLADMKVNPACGGAAAPPAPRAVAFYHWEPSADFSVDEWDQMERIVMPGRKCGEKPDASSLSDWRCDFEPERLAKIRSIRISSRAPLIDQFLKNFQISSSQINEMLGSLEEAKGGPSAPLTHEAIFTVACKWVKDNQQTWERWPSIDRKLPIEVPFFAYAWDPMVFFFTFICIVVASLVWCLGLDGIFISGRGLRQKWNWKLDFVPRLVPRCSKAQDQKSTKVNDATKKVQEVAVNPRGVVTWAAPIFYDVNSADHTKIYAALLRLGDCSSVAEVQIKTVGGTAVAGAQFKSITSIVRFEPTEQVKWVAIDRMKDRGWKNEEFFRVVLTEVVSGLVVIGGLASSNCIVSDDRAYPGLKERADLDKPRGRRQFVLALLKDFVYTHGEKDEGLRLFWVFYEAFYSSIVSNLLYGILLIDICILGRNYYGFLIYVVVELVNVFLERLSSTHQFRVAAGDLRTEMHLFCGRKLVMPFFLNYSGDVDFHFMNCHTYSTDLGAGTIYSSLYKIYKSVLQLIMAITLNFALSKPGTKGSNSLLAVYQFVPLAIMIPGCIICGYFWKREWRWKHECKHEESREERVKMAFWLVSARKTSKTFGRGFMTDAYDKDFAQAVRAEFKDGKQEAMHEMDCRWLATNFADFIIVGLWVTLGLVLIESRTYGAGSFSLGGLVTTIGIYRMLKSATLSLCDSCQAIEDAVAMMQSTRDFLEGENQLATFANLQQKRMKQFGIEDKPTVSGDWPKALSCAFQNVVAKDSTGHEWKFDGMIPLCHLYCISTESHQDEIEAFIGLWQMTILPESGAVVLPPFVRVIALSGGNLPELFNRTALQNVLVFADTNKYNEDHARVLLKLLDVFGKSTVTNLLAHHTGEGEEDPFNRKLHPSEVSVENRMLIVLAQVILADPEVIIFDRPLLFTPGKLVPRVLSVLVAWQRGGPEAVFSLSQKIFQGGKRQSFSNLEDISDVLSPHFKDKNIPGCPEWLDSIGKVDRTLVLSAHKALGLEEKLKQYGVAERLYLDHGHLSVDEGPPIKASEMSTNGIATNGTKDYPAPSQSSSPEDSKKCLVNFWQTNQSNDKPVEHVGPLIGKLRTVDVSL